MKKVTTGGVGQHGPIGSRGSTCPRGVQGAKGLRGVAGIQGEHGPKGHYGTQGLVGDKGDRGERGERGERGAKGEKGIQGANSDVLSVLADHLPIQLATRYGEKMCFVKYHVSEDRSSIVESSGGLKSLRTVSAYGKFVNGQGHARVNRERLVIRDEELRISLITK